MVFCQSAGTRGAWIVCAGIANSDCDVMKQEQRDRMKG